MSRTSKPTSVRLSHTCRGSDPDTHSAVKEGHALLLRIENNARPGGSGKGWRIPSPFPQLPSSETQRLPKGQAARLPDDGSEALRPLGLTDTCLSAHGSQRASLLVRWAAEGEEAAWGKQQQEAPRLFPNNSNLLTSGAVA